MAASSQARTRAPRLGSLLCKRQESSPDSSSWRPRHPSLRRYRCQERLALETRSDFPGWLRLARQSSRYSCTEKHTPAAASGAARRPSPPRKRNGMSATIYQLSCTTTRLVYSYGTIYNIYALPCVSIRVGRCPAPVCVRTRDPVYQGPALRGQHPCACPCVERLVSQRLEILFYSCRCSRHVCSRPLVLVELEKQ